MKKNKKKAREAAKTIAEHIRGYLKYGNKTSLEPLIKAFTEFILEHFPELPKPSSKWISVKERLPEDNEWVACWVGLSWIRASRICGEWHRDCGKMLPYPDYQVTHWMQIPPLPDDDNDKQ